MWFHQEVVTLYVIPAHTLDNHQEKNMKKILYPILAVIVFTVMQAVAGIAIYAVALFKDPELLKKVAQTGDQSLLESAVGTSAIAWGVILSGIVTVGIIALLKMVDWKTVLNFKMINWKAGALAILGAICIIFFLDAIEEIIDLPNLMEDTFTNMSNSLIGAIGIGIIGPIIEEFIFREGVLGYMLRGGVNKWVAISASALAFGIIHINPAQVPFAAAMGFIFGIIYYKTGNIVIPCLLHMINNSVAVWQMYSMGEAAKDFSMVEWMGGLGVSACYVIPCFIIGCALLYHFWRKHQTPTYYQEQNEQTLA